MNDVRVVDETVETLDIDKDMESAFSSFSPDSETKVRINNGGISIQEHVDNLHVLFSNQDLDMAKSDIQTLKKELKTYQETLEKVQHQLKERNEIIASIKLERDLAAAEKNLIRHYYNRAEGRLAKDKCANECSDDAKQIRAFHQFIPYTNNAGEDWQGGEAFLESDDDVSRRLLSCWNTQDQLNAKIVKNLQGKEDFSRQNRPRLLNFITLLFRLKFREVNADMKTIRKALKVLSLRKKWKRKDPNLKYHAMQDNKTIVEDDESIVEWTDYSSGKYDENGEKGLINEVLACREVSQKCIADANTYMLMQARKIKSLEKELDLLMDVNMSLTISSSRSEDDISQDSNMPSDIIGIDNF